jgi:NADPH:quinone reductase-like Zn-dependent oxidoreductase
VGTFAIQLAKLFGARVIAICSRRNLDFCKGLGANEVADYEVTPPEELDITVDCFFDAYGNKSFETVKHLLTSNGNYITTVPSKQTLLDLESTRLSAAKAHLIQVRSNMADLEYLAAQMVAKKVSPVIECAYPIARVIDAHKHIETKRTRGKLVLTLE